MAIIIRPYRESDRPAVRAMTIAAFEGVSIDHNLDDTLGPIAGKDWRWRKGRDIELDIDMPESELAVAEDEASKSPVGYVTLKMDPETRIGWIHNLAVTTDLRGQGLGRRLI
jgi:predicted N-acetyltransferase YhbS